MQFLLFPFQPDSPVLLFQFLYSFQVLQKQPFVPLFHSGTLLSAVLHTPYQFSEASFLSFQVNQQIACQNGAMCHCLMAAIVTRDLTDSSSRQSSSSASGVSIINPRHCLRNAGESHEIRKSSAALLKRWHEDGETNCIPSCSRINHITAWTHSREILPDPSRVQSPTHSLLRVPLVRVRFGT